MFRGGDIVEKKRNYNTGENSMLTAVLIFRIAQCLVPEQNLIVYQK